MNGQKALPNGAHGMYAGDADGNRIIEDSDKDAYWTVLAGEEAYLSANFSMEGQVDYKDKNDIYVVNNGTESQVPE